MLKTPCKPRVGEARGRGPGQAGLPHREQGGSTVTVEKPWERGAEGANAPEGTVGEEWPQEIPGPGLSNV